MNAITENIVEILEVGLSGFVFLLIWLSYRLLKFEQQREQDIRPGISRIILAFMGLSLVSAVLVASQASFELARRLDHEQFQRQVAKCRDDLEVLQSISRLKDQSVGNLQAAINRTAEQCNSVLVQLDNASP